MLGSMRLASYGEFRIALVVQACIHVPVVVLELIIGFVRFKAFPVFRNVFYALPVPSVKKFHLRVVGIATYMSLSITDSETETESFEGDWTINADSGLS